MKPRTTLCAVLVTAATLVAPSAAGAASATVTGDAGEAIALGGPVQIRNMAPTVVPAFSADEKGYTIEVLGPDGSTTVSNGLRCGKTSSADPQAVRYLGNGTYTVKITTTTDENDFYCEKFGAPQVFTFTIAASTGLTAPAATLPLRKLGDADVIEHQFPITAVPGAERYVAFLAVDAKLGPDGGILGDPHFDTAQGSERSVSIGFPGPGRYTIVTQAQRGNGASPFSAPIFVNVVAPFDFSDAPYLWDSRGPGYQVRARVRELSAAGEKIAVSIARGKGKFKRLVTAKIASEGRFTFRFKQRRKGSYRLKYVFKGSATVVAGTYVQKATLY